MKEKLVHEVWGMASRTEGGDEPAGVGTGEGGGGLETHLREQQPRRLWTLQAEAWRAAGEPPKGWGSRGLTCFDQPDQRNPPEAEHVKNSQVDRNENSRTLRRKGSPPQKERGPLLLGTPPSPSFPPPHTLSSHPSKSGSLGIMA